MDRGIALCALGARAQQDALDVVASNVANAGTVGYRAERVSFQQMLAKAKDVALVGLAPGALDPSAGPLRQTGNPLDLALDGDGYFAVEGARGVRYTRAGAFRVGPGGALETTDGNPLRARGGGALVIPPGAGRIEVTSDGVVRADGANVGALELVRFAPQALAPEGRGLLVARQAPLGEGSEGTRPPQVVAGALELANVSPMRSVMELIRASRTYETLHRMIESYGEIDQRTAREIGKPR
jgi:flagellar basal body rod protein FlgG